MAEAVVMRGPSVAKKHCARIVAFTPIKPCLLPHTFVKEYGSRREAQPGCEVNVALGFKPHLKTDVFTSMVINVYLPT